MLPANMKNGMATAPHALASQSAAGVLREGGNAVEAMIAAAATIAVVYPHMNGIGGDGFWLILRPGMEPVGIEACGVAAQSATIESYRARGFGIIPVRGPLAANTVAGTVSGWDLAHHWSRDVLRGTVPLARLLEDATRYARDGVAVTASQERAIATHRDGLQAVAGFADVYLPGGRPVPTGGLFRQPRLAATLEQLGRAGLDDFYRGELARGIAHDLQRSGSPLSLPDLEQYRARLRTPLSLRHSLGTIYNMPPPAQGLVSLLILGQLDRILRRDLDPVGAEFVHACVEATKLAFDIRDTQLTDPDYMTVDPADLLTAERLDALAGRISPRKAAAWGRGNVARRHGLVGYLRRPRRCGQLHPEHLPRVWQRCRAAAVRHHLAKPRLQFLAGSRGAQFTAPGPQAVSYVESGRRPVQRWTDFGLRQHGRRWPAAIPGRDICAHGHLRERRAGGDRCTAVVAWPDMGPVLAIPEAGVALSGTNVRNTAATRARRRAHERL